MSREQQTDHQAEQRTEAPESARNGGDIQGLPPNLYMQAMQIGPGDVQGLRDLLTLFPDFGPQILAVVSPNAGLSTVKRAQAMVQQNAVGRGGSLSDEQIHEGGEFALEGSAREAEPAQPAATQAPAPTAAEPSQPASTLSTMELSEVPLQDHVRKAVMALQPGDAQGLQQLLNLYPSMSDALLPLAKEHLGVETVAQAVALDQELASRNSAMAEKKSQEATDGDLLTKSVVFDDLPGARKFNEAHPALVAEFNELTQNALCFSETGEIGSIDPLKVARWQAHRGLDADGKVGPRTVAAARKEAQATVVASSLDPEIDPSTQIDV